MFMDNSYLDLATTNMTLTCYTVTKQTSSKVTLGDNFFSLVCSQDPNHATHDQHDQHLVAYQAVGKRIKYLEFDHLVLGIKIPIMAFHDQVHHQPVVQHANDRNEGCLDFD